ncbi:hypothetical protein BBO99_00006627 [Phytophthora kernoviae]|uniref:ABC1 atypical kinase-like domain-containing protein n=2 Tax=Phytophthora kernoviae TaxID=325452 RepID=A0A3R7JXJ7_9STRA|nr:hypothetical protein G195_008004 [Phytophthora kernoviae 00238/432]KAG2512309.1 hypothetical protein JM16_005459 [Phytophthora kernoviae]KAG2522008.1 hypothetical protein JM18_005343 [Phytophthora kernoviae]RLN10403.1 hypothetical protein BBI17_006728 [Phytophthora kernoviae]RLN77575.1 hypothetical protein BBO99_00006627 [Phytophthora kernoviae]
MWTQDFVRVLQGASKVAEQIARTQGPEVATKTQQFSKHASELSRLVPYFLNGDHNNVTPPSGDETPVTPEPAKPQQKNPEVLKHQVPIPKPETAKIQVPTESFKPRKPLKPSVKPLEPAVNSEEKTPETVEAPPRVWEEKHVPSSPLSRILGFGGLAAKLAVGTAAEIVRSGGKGGTYNALVSDSNVEKLAETLCTMRGAALKLGQMLSIQDEAMIPTKLAAALDRVRENAHVMPKDQLHHQLKTELGEDWRSNFQEFDDVPIAAASIGQVHRATLLNGDRVAIKIQYPGIAESIGSDLLNLKRLVTYTNILPRGLYIDEIIRVGKEELTAECDYLSEADNQERFNEFIQQSGMDGKYVVPRVYRELSTSRILTTQLISGVAVDKAVHLSQEVRNSIARRILQLTIHELFNWRFMQTDPNWSNFMYNASTDTVGLVDFGAAREYPKAFVDDYFNIVWAAANEDEKTLVDYSIKMHFLTGDESPGMMRAHIAAGMVVGEPFRSHEPFDFQKSRLTTRLGQHTGEFMHGRLTPPPQEVYSLHRKLAGAFLMCIKLRAVVPCRDVLEEVQRTYYS